MLKNIHFRFLFLIIFQSYLFNAGCFAQDEEFLSRGPESGTLLIIGGHASDSLFLPLFSQLIGGYDKSIVIIPTAREDQSLSKDSLFLNLTSRFREAGFQNISVLHTRNRDVANSEEFTQIINNAKSIWFQGGRQWRLADSYLNTKTHDAIFDLLDRGGVVAGTSAGASIQGSYLARGDTKMNTIMVGDHEEGLGLISNTAIDQHLLARNRQFDMFEILEVYPHLLGIGLDENTGIIVKADTFEVVGESFVSIYDGKRWSAERDTIYKLPEGSKEFYLLDKGKKYDLRKREIIIEDQD